MSSIDLTPAQQAFLEEHIAGFSAERWTATSAGKAGSDRHFIRIGSAPSDGPSFVLIVWDSLDPDWDRFLGMARDISERLDLLPAIFAADADHGLILEEDLGAMTLKRLCSDNAGDTVRTTYRRVLECAARWHGLGGDAGEMVRERVMDEEMFLWETGYFADHCVRDYFGRECALDSAWERERATLAAEAARLPLACMHRDFQSENIMVTDGRIRFIDFQGARLGPREYDLASLLLDPYVDIGGDESIETMLSYYTEVSGVEITGHAFRTAAAQRLMQALGAFGNLSIHKGRQWYRDYIPIALERLSRILTTSGRYHAIARVVEECRRMADV